MCSGIPVQMLRCSQQNPLILKKLLNMTVEKVYFTTKPFSDAEETLEVTHRYIAEALKDSDSLLYILLKEGKIIGVCTVDVSGNSNYLYGLAIAEAYRGQGYGSYLVKSVVNQLIAQNDEAFQIVVEDSNIGAKRLYENIGFVKQTQVVYLKQKWQTQY